jgi:hypothetical protein
MTKTSRAILALMVAFGLLALMAWFDAAVLVDAQARGRATFDSGQASLLFALGAFAIAGSVLLVTRLALDSGSVAVAVIYLLVGGFFAFLWWILASFATYMNDVPPLFPDPLAIAVAQVFVSTTGPLHAVSVIGAGMAIAGIAVLVRSRRERGTRS